MNLPPRLTRNSRVAVIAPASAPPDPQRYREGIAALRGRGMHVEALEDVAAMGYLAGPDDLRLEALNELLGRDDLDAIFCARGGFGTLRLIPELDFDALAQRPKLIIGYSDITALQLAVLTKAGVPSVSGPMVAPDWSRMDHYSEQVFWDVVGGEAPLEIDNPGGEPLWTICKGEAEGVLIGGNLTMFSSLIGTPFMPSLDGAILFLEEIGEPPYRVDRLFAQLELAGVLDSISGMVLGAFTGASVEEGRPTLHLQEVIRHYAEKVDGPVAAGLVYGHLRPKASLPIGVKASLESRPQASFLTILESPTA